MIGGVCVYVTVDGEWGNWGSWSTCIVTCHMESKFTNIKEVKYLNLVLALLMYNLEKNASYNKCVILFILQPMVDGVTGESMVLVQ